MSNKNSYTQTLKVSAAFIVVFGILLSSFGRGNAPTAHAQEAGTVTFTSSKFEQSSMAATVTLGEPGLSYRYVTTFGETGVPYLADGTHLNKPNGLFIDPANNLYTVEENGYRMLKFNASGVNTLTIGHVGQPWQHEDSLSIPMDVAVDSSGNIWVVISTAIKEFDSAGNLLQIFPETNPWESGDANDRFNSPRGIAFDSNGDMYISDNSNHRIQVYDVSGGTPTYLETIGETGVPHSDNSGFSYQGQIAFDSLGRLYVVDSSDNFRVQRCTKSGTWTCETFFGETGVQGNDLSHLSWALGIAIKNDFVYIADGGNNRVLKCTTESVCNHFAGVNGVPGSDNSHFKWISDVAVDSLGNVYVSDIVNYRIQKFNSSGVYLKTIGVKGVPYLTDDKHINTPWGIGVDATGDIYTVEHFGYRLLKFNSAGIQQWAVGKPGVASEGGGKFGGTYVSGPEGNPGVDAEGRVYVTDTHNNRVQIYNATGNYFATLGTGWGQGDYEFACPTGAAVNSINGDIYIADHCNHRIQVFTNALVYKATLGETGVEGDDNQHFRWPWGVVIANNGDIFVADTDNFRVQKCNFTSGVNYTCSTFAGETGIAPDGTYDHIHPLSVAVDSNGRVFVVDDWNNRVMVYDSAGAFLTSIGGEWSELTGGLISPSGVAVDKNGNVYVADRDNHRIQKFAPGVPGWEQTNINGFGEQANEAVFALGTFDGALYAGTYHPTDGAQIWSSPDGSNWSSVMISGFGNVTNAGIDHFIEFNGKVYAGTLSDEANGGEIWRSSDGSNWDQVVSGGFGSTDQAEVFRFTIFNNQLYASTWSYSDTDGGDVWRSDTGDLGDWQNVVDNGFGNPTNKSVVAFEVFGGNLYAGTRNVTLGGQVWRTDTGDTGDWQQVNPSGFGFADNGSISALASFNGYLYAITRNWSEDGVAQVWRCQQCDNFDWEEVTGGWSTHPETKRNAALEVFGNSLYAVIGNDMTGLEVWQTSDGVKWNQIGFTGFEGSNNRTIYWDNALLSFDNELYLGTSHRGGGGQIWKYQRPVIMNINTITDTGDSTLSEGEQVIVPVTKLTVTFNKDIKTPKVANFSLTKGSTVITINSVNYDSLTKTVTLNINNGKKLPFGKYTLTIKKNITDTDKNIMGINFVRHFTLAKPPSISLLLSPANNAVLSNLQPKLDWSNSTFPAGTTFDHYQLQLAMDAAFTSPMEQNTAISEFTLLSPLVSGTKYYWRVRAYNTLGQSSAWSTVFNFTTP